MRFQVWVGWFALDLSIINSTAEQSDGAVVARSHTSDTAAHDTVFCCDFALVRGLDAAAAAVGVTHTHV